MKRKQKYQNTRTREIKEFSVAVDSNGHVFALLNDGGDVWRAVSDWSLNLVNSQFFFESAHRNDIKTTKPPLDGSDFPYGVT